MGGQVGSKIGFQRSFYPSWYALGSGSLQKASFEVISERSERRKSAKTHGFLHISDESALRALGSFWVPLGAFWGPFSGPKRALKRTPEASEKRSENDAQKKDPNWPPETPQRHPSWPPNRPQIGPGPSFFFQDPLGDRLGRSGGLPGAQDPPGTPPGPPPGASREPPGTLPGTPRDASEAPGPTRDPPPGPSVNPLRGTIDDLSTFVSKDPTRPPQDSLRDPPWDALGTHPALPFVSSLGWRDSRSD